MRRAAVACGVTLALGAVLVAVGGVVERRDEAFTLNVGQAFPLPALDGGDELCQRPIDVSADFDRVRLGVGTFKKDGSPFRVVVRAPGGDSLAGVRVAGGYADNLQHVVDVGTVREGSQVAVCVVNEGPRRIAVYGAPGLSTRTSDAYRNGRPLGQDASFGFLRDGETSLIALVPDMVERASLFHGSWIDAWLVWVLVVAALAGVPAALVFALHSAGRADTSP